MGSFLIASLVWGSIGLGFVVYGKRQSAVVPLVGGIALIAISYFVGSVLVMSIIGAGLVAAMIRFRNVGG
jgi:hypothetical protein